jgi:hypothetical protein
MPGRREAGISSKRNSEDRWVSFVGRAAAGIDIAAADSKPSLTTVILRSLLLVDS